jgi:hypothetical protein
VHKRALCAPVKRYGVKQKILIFNDIINFNLLTLKGGAGVFASRNEVRILPAHVK